MGLLPLPWQLPKKCRNGHGESRRAQCSILRGGAIGFRSTSGETTLEESELIRVAGFWFVTKCKHPASCRACLLRRHAMVHKLRYERHAYIELFLSNAFKSSLEASPGFRLSGKPPGCPFRGSATVRWQRALNSAADLSAERGFRSIPRIARTRQSVRRIGANCGLDRGVNSSIYKESVLLAVRQIGNNERSQFLIWGWTVTARSQKK